VPNHPVQPNEIFTKYRLVCSHPGCKGRQEIDQAQSAGLQVGSIVPDHPQDFHFGRCPICKRTGMRVVQGPPVPAPQKPKGWVRIPTK
jgi:hypothetical protein